MENKTTPYSNLKIFAHPDKLEAIKKGIRTAPVYVRLKPTNSCNHRCFYCSYADQELGLRNSVNPGDSISWEKMEEIINDFKDMNVKAVTLSGGGEPLTYKHIENTMSGLLANGIELSIITNGHLLENNLAKILAKSKWVRISIDAADKETYSSIRNIPENSFEKVCYNIYEFSKIKNKNCELGVNFVINHQNCGQVYEAARLFKELGVNHIKYTARITKDLDVYHGTFKQHVIGEIHRAVKELSDNGYSIINKYESDFESSTVFHRNYKKCYIKEIVVAIAADSKVYFCHDKAYVSSGVVGDLKEKSFRELWFSKEVEERYSSFDASLECNHHCVYDDRNILLNDFFNLDENQINFI